MKKGLTLIELQVTLLLTLVLMAILFLFTTYFWRNHYVYNQQLTFQRESEQFCLWLNHQMRNAVDVKQGSGNLTFVLARGGSEQLHWGEAGPMVSGLDFFSEPVSLEIQVIEKTNTRSLNVKLTQGERDFQWRQTFQSLAYVGLMEAAFAD